ncbi:oligoendopeptidase F [Ligilactobacillus sp. Marseille-Q7487]|jgi:oligoendopeptidase F|uniref:oligoendopeptidase F n=1 Tax=Ligilactobacillus sp. Marseille-Q7487 TaxID=3022128 RepID=UPI0024A83C79|nr:oligoendopeptidase F [Ligilactobacillus sp. Marseille-Q7487]
MGLPARKDIPKELTWDVSALYKSQEEWQEDIVLVKKLVANLKKDFTGKLNNAFTIQSALHALETITQKLSWIEHFAFLQQAVDMTDPNANQLLRTYSQLDATLSSELTFVETEILANSDQVLDEVSSAQPRFASVIRHFKQAKKHRLSPEVEKTLAMLNPTLNGPENLYTTCRAADMDFEPITLDKQTYPLSFVLYENTYQYSPDHKLRRAAFKEFSKTLRRYQNTIAANYYNHVSTEKTIATLRGYDSVFDYLLDKQEVSREMFTRQIDMIMDGLGPVMQKYVKLIAKKRGLKEITFADLQIDLDPDFAPKVALKEAPAYTSKALAPLGLDYHDMIMQSFKERWVDFACNAGKETGGFETDPYGTHPYILMSWTDEMADVYTLLHELGHAGQALLTAANNSILACNPSTYLVEAPSTFNELLLTDSLAKDTTDLRMQRYAYCKTLTNTYYHNFVTHLLEAAFQREVYNLIDQGQGFDGPKLCELKKAVLKRFWGDTVKIDDDASLTWMRQSHYYMGLYSYTYSAGLTIATQAFLSYQANGSKQIARWLDFLKLGDQQPPLQAALVAGVDISTSEPLANTIAFLDQTVDKIIDLTAQIDAK